MKKLIINEKEINLVGINEDVNLCNLSFSCNNGVFVVKDRYFETNDLNEYGFRIDTPTRFSAYVTTQQYMYLTKQLMENQKSFKAEFLPEGYMKGQNESLWNLTLEFGYENQNRIPNVKVLNFGNSYGDLRIDDIEVELSHAGGSSYDSTSNWNLFGKNKYTAIKYLVELLTRKIVSKAA